MEEAPKLEVEALPAHLKYALLGKDDSHPIVIVADHNGR